MKKYAVRVILIILAFMAGVMIIFTLSSISSRLRDDNQSLIGEASADEPQDEHILIIYAWANELSSTGTEQRILRELTGDRAMYVGSLKQRVPLSVLFPEVGYEGFYCYDYVGGDSDFCNPVITFEYDGGIECRYSIDFGEGWLGYGAAENYLLKSSNFNGDASAYGSGSLTVCPNVCGLVNLEGNLGYCSDAMQKYNSYEKIRLLDICPELPIGLDQPIGGRFTLHLFVTAYDPADAEKVNASADIEITYFTGGSLDYSALINSGHGDKLDSYELYSYIKLRLADYSQIETVQ